MAAEHAASQGETEGAASGERGRAAAAGGLSLMPMTEGVRVFKCPSCGHQEELSARGLAELEKCPACKQDIKKLLAKEEAEQAEAGEQGGSGEAPAESV